MQKRGGMVGGGGQRDMPPARMQYWSKASRDLELRAERKPVVTERMASISFGSWGGSVAVAAVVSAVVVVVVVVGILAVGVGGGGEVLPWLNVVQHIFCLYSTCSQRVKSKDQTKNKCRNKEDKTTLSPSPATVIHIQVTLCTPYHPGPFITVTCCLRGSRLLGDLSLSYLLIRGGSMYVFSGSGYLP